MNIGRLLFEGTQYWYEHKYHMYILYVCMYRRLLARGRKFEEIRIRMNSRFVSIDHFQYSIGTNFQMFKIHRLKNQLMP